MFARERTSARARVHLREEIKRQREYGCGRAAAPRCDMKRTQSTLGIARMPLVVVLREIPSDRVACEIAIPL